MTGLPRPALLLIAAALLAAPSIIPTQADGASGAMPPPIVRCTQDTDCPGCQRCQAGACELAEWSGETCMCDAECKTAGAVACELSATKPLCGGRCSNRQPARELPCGAGDDVTRVEPFPGSARQTPAAAVLRMDRVLVERETRP